MEQIYSKGRAKINLALDVTGLRDDGYHAVCGIMQSLVLFDVLHIKKVYKPDYFKLVSNLPWLPTDERNLVWRAAHYLIERFEIKTGIFISIDKAIPASAGLAGGSADCAAALLGIRDLFELPLSDAEIQELSVQFGADVPFCVMKGCALATGIGEVLEPLPRLPYMHILLAKPPAIVSTEHVFRQYKRFDAEKITRPDVGAMIDGIRAGDLPAICNAMGNALEQVTAAKHPVIFDIKALMTASGAAAAMMSGSGPTVFGIFTGKAAAIAAGRAIKAALPEIGEIIVTKPYYQ